MAIDKNQEGDVEQANTRVDFETAITACGFGVYNVCLLLVCVPAMSSPHFETISISYILAVAECDLKLSLIDKGLLNGMTYAGMIATALFWGYLADTILGRKRCLVYGLLLEAVCVVGASLSQNLTQLLIFKFFGGAIACGPYAVIMSYICEMHRKEHRSGVMMTTGMMTNIAAFTLPVIAWIILPKNLNFDLAALKFRGWQLFLVLTAIPSIVSGLLLLFFPESPKFLMSQGRNEEALEVFKTIYSWNTRKDKSTFKIKQLLEEVPQKQYNKEQANQSIGSAIRQSFIHGLRQMAPLYKSPYLRLSILVYTLQFSLLVGQNSFRLWLPQIFASIEEFMHKKPNTPVTMCNILDYNVHKTNLVKNPTNNLNSTCEVHIESNSYVNNIIVSGSSFMGSLLASFLVNILGNKPILCCAIAISLGLELSFYYANSATCFLVQAALFVTISGVAVTTVISASVNIFPTTMRTMVIVLVQTFGRLGALLGNMLFPVLMSIGCIEPFILVGLPMFCGFVLSLFLPDYYKLSLQ